MATMSGTCEIVEAVEESCSQEQHIAKPVRKYSIENDINKLFEAIDLRNSRRSIEQGDRDGLRKSAMKRPMRISYSQPSGIGISESVSLKQALRGLCISQASEMAAVKKRSSKPSGFADPGAVKKLYQTLIVETNDSGRGNLMEISLVPESNTSSQKALESNQVSDVEQSNHCAESLTLSSNDSTQKAEMAKELSVDEIVPSSADVGCQSSEARSEHSEKLKVPRPIIDAPNPNLIRRVFTNKSFRKKQPMRNTTPSSGGFSQQNSGPNTFSGCSSSDEVCQTPKSAVVKGSKEEDEVSPMSSSVNTSMEANSKADKGSRSAEKGEISQSSSSIGDYSSTTSYSDDSLLSGASRSGYRSHMSRDVRWEAINCVKKNRNINLGLRNFKLLKKLGGGDIGTVYLSELVGTNCLFAIKVMDNDFLAGRRKMVRALTEKEILEMLDHPFLPTLYANFTTDKYSCLVMEYCPGGDLHVLRQKQPSRSFSEQAARFYVAEVLLALEYLHMLGVVYRDLKPENVLVREDGHIMLTDFDLSLRCSVNPTLLKSSSPIVTPPRKMSSPCSESSCIDPFCLNPSWQVSCFTPKFLSAASKSRKLKSDIASQVSPLPQLVVEPTSARSNSFVGTHEYLAPEIIKAEGHGSAVDWWTLGIFLYELLYSKTPFKGPGNEDTLANVVSQCLRFPETPMVSSHARDLIRRLLQKEPENRLGSERGAAEIKQHPFFEGLNFALIRCAIPPELPKVEDSGYKTSPETVPQNKESGKCKKEVKNTNDDMVFEMF